MRIISGRFKGQKLQVLRKGVRPTTDRVKESLFSIIRYRLSGVDVLDLFAGIGGLGFEALSEGARSCCFVDKSYKAISMLKSNCIHLGIDENVEYYRSSAAKFLDQINSKSYDIIFIDPPYALYIIKKIVNKIIETNTLKENGLIIAESRIDEKIEKADAKIIRVEKYGETKLTFFGH
ncbi:MAG: 16S rRNA (guanine(966)-N(2))-methyltransferase RsmD [Candidatus Cloacimonadota bacterium]|nr:16S rRNA (guanine(966)-N(2))-methyltransferase RsmD [Candidatus Cloacimonadota bacterium]